MSGERVRDEKGRECCGNERPSTRAQRVKQNRIRLSGHTSYEAGPHKRPTLSSREWPVDITV